MGIPKLTVYWWSEVRVAWGPLNFSVVLKAGAVLWQTVPLTCQVHLNSGWVVTEVLKLQICSSHRLHYHSERHIHPSNANGRKQIITDDSSSSITIHTNNESLHPSWVLTLSTSFQRDRVFSSPVPFSSLLIKYWTRVPSLWYSTWQVLSYTRAFSLVVPSA